MGGQLRRRPRSALGILLLATLAAALAAACGGGDDQGAVAAVLEQVLGIGQVPGARLVVRVGEGVEGFPQEFPIYRGAKLVASFRSEDRDGTSYLATFSTSDPVGQVISFYERSLGQVENWQVVGVTLSAQGGAVRFVDPDDPDFDGSVVVSRPDKPDARTNIGASLSFGGRQPQREVTAFQLGENLPLPQGFPNDLPIYPGATVIATAWFRSGEETTSYLLRLLTTDFEEQVIDFYRQRLETGGWEIGDDFQDERGFGLTFSDRFNESLAGTVAADVFSDDTQYTEVILQVDTEETRPR